MTGAEELDSASTQLSYVAPFAVKSLPAWPLSHVSKVPITDTYCALDPSACSPSTEPSDENEVRAALVGHRYAHVVRLQALGLVAQFERGKIRPAALVDPGDRDADRAGLVRGFERDHGLLAE